MARCLWLALLLCASCAADQLTEVVVTIEAEPGVRGQSQTLSVRVLDLALGQSDPLFVNDHAPWNGSRFTLALSPSNPRAAGRYVVEASAQKAGVAIASARLISGFVQGQTRYVRMILEDACLGVLGCGPGTTCSRGSCIDATVDPAQFAPSSELAPSTSTLPAPSTGTPDASLAPRDAARGDDAMAPSPIDAAQPAQPDAATRAAPDATTNAEPDAQARGTPDGGTAPPPDAAAPAGDAGPALAGRCAPGHYEGNFTGSYRFGTFSALIGVREAPVSGAAAAEAAPLSLMLESDPSQVGTLRVAYGCMNGVVPINAMSRPFRARVTGSLDCATGQLTGRIAGLLVPSDTADLDARFEGPLSASFDGPSGSFESGVWSAAEPASAGVTPGDGNGRWSAAWKSTLAPVLNDDPCRALP